MPSCFFFIRSNSLKPVINEQGRARQLRPAEPYARVNVLISVTLYHGR
jgi:hypothetical protein